MVSDAMWQETAKACLPLLYKVACEVTHNSADAQDAVQQALLHTWEKRGRIRPDALRAYMTRAVINEGRTLLRRSKQMTPVAEFPAVAAPEKPDLRPLMAAIAALPEHLRLPVTLKYLQDLSEKECAAALGLPLTTFRSRLFRARKALREALEEEVNADA